MKHVFVIDPKPFRGQQWKMDGLLDSIGQFFRTQEKANFSSVASYYPRSAIGLIQKQVDEADEDETVRVYAIGGDEILFDCLNGISGLPNMELAVVPHGSANNFVRSFGEGKAEFFKDIPAQVDSSTIPTDVIHVGNNCAINGCAVGFAPALIMQKREIRTRLEKGISRFFIGFWFFVNNITSIFDRELIAHHYDISVDGVDYSGEYGQINIVNAPYFGRKKHALKGAMPNDGLLEVVMFKATRPFSTLASFRRHLAGKMPSNCVRIQAKKIEVKSANPIWIQTDSEFLQDTSITFEVVPEAVQIVTVNYLTYQGT